MEEPSDWGWWSFLRVCSRADGYFVVFADGRALRFATKRAAMDTAVRFVLEHPGSRMLVHLNQAWGVPRPFEVVDELVVA